MEALEVLDLIGVKDAIKRSFASVFGELNLATEAWFQKTKLLTVGRDNYSDYIATKIGVFPLFATNRSASVDTSFVSVEISTDIERDRYRSRGEIERGLERVRRGEDSDLTRRQSGMSVLKSITSTSGGFALVGIPGSGKTTLFRSIALRSARGEPVRGRKRIPVFLAIRDLSSKGTGIMEAMVSLFEQLQINEADRVVEGLLKSGDCIVLLDGLDETSNEHQHDLIRELLEIKTKHNSCIFCVSARPSSLSIGLPDFTKWETLPLALTERLAFIKKWFSSVDPAKGQRLIEKGSNKPELLDLGSNPLMLSIVCALFNNDLDIPADPDELYERAVHGLLGGWDAFRNIARRTVLRDVPVRKRVVIVSWLAAELFVQGKLVFTASDVNEANTLRRLTELVQVGPLDADELLTSLYNDFGILIERSPNLYSFSHLTIHEYLVAKYIVDNRQEQQLLKSHRTHKKWEEIIRLVGKMLPNADDFMNNLQNSKVFSDPNQIMLLEATWSSKPICSIDVRKKLMMQIAAKIDGMTKRFAGFSVHQRHAMGMSLLISVHVASAEALNADEKRFRYTFPPFVTYIPNLLRILKLSGFMTRELGVVTSPLFQALAKANVDEVADVLYIYADSGEPINFSRDGFIIPRRSYST